MQPSFYLNERHFSAMLVAACLAHMAAAMVYMLAPKEQVAKIPVHVLNVKLGGGDLGGIRGVGGGETLSPRIVDSATFTPQPAATKSAVIVPPKPAPAQPPKPKPQPKPKAEAPKPAPSIKDLTPAPVAPAADASAVAAPSASAAALPFSATARPSQYVRAGEGGYGSGRGSAYGNSVSPDAEVMQRYTQLISMWVNRHKSVFTRALRPGMKGNIIVRLQIDRRGNIHFFRLDKATGVPAADAAAMAMVKAANPVPPVPANYPGGNMFEFLISVGYTA